MLRARNRRALVAVLLLVVVTQLVGACAVDPAPGPVTRRHPLPRLPELGSALLPTGFTPHEAPVLGSADRRTYADTGFFEFEGFSDLGGHHCRAQVTVSPYDPLLVSAAAYAEELGHRHCDADWFVSAYETGWQQPDPTDPGMWVLRLTYREVGLFGSRAEPAVAAVLIDPVAGHTVGVWATERLYSLDEAVAVAHDVARSIGQEE